MPGFPPAAVPVRPASGGGLRTSIRYAIADSIVAQPIVVIAVPANVYLVTLFTKGFGLSSAAIGAIAAVPFVCQVLQLPVSPFLARWCSSKTATLTGVAMQLLTWGALALALPFIPRDDPGLAAWSLGSLIFLSWMFGAISGVSWMAWLQEWVPPRLLGQFFSRRNRLAQCATLGSVFLIGWVLAETDYSLAAFQGVIATAVTLRAVSFVLLWRSPTLAPPARVEPGRPLREQWIVIRRNPAFRSLIAFSGIWTLGYNCFGPFYNVFLLEQLAFSAFEVGVISMLTVLGGIFTLPLWGWLIDRHGHRPAMLVSLLLWECFNVFWCVLVPENRLLAYFLGAWSGLAGVGFLLGQFTLLLKLVPADAKNFAISVTMALTSLLAAVAPAIGGATLGWALRGWPDHPLALYHLCFTVQPMLALLAALILRHLPEPGAGHVDDILRSVRLALLARGRAWLGR